MKRIITSLIMTVVLVAMCLGCSPSTTATKATTTPKEKFTVMWSIYVGWMPWSYAQQSGILKKWADKYNIEIDLQRADYIPSIETYVSGKSDAVVMTNMEALNMAASAGVDTTAIIIGDYSNGNDAVLTRNGLQLCDLKGKTVSIVELSVSQYLLERGIELQCKDKMTIDDVKLSNIGDSDIGAGFIVNPSTEAVVTWNPIVLSIEDQLGNKVTRAFDSSKIPHEILDIMFVNTDVLNKHPELAQALVGAWYEVMSEMKGQNSDTSMLQMATGAGTTIGSFKKQLGTTYLYWSATDAATFAKSDKLKEVMDKVRTFSFDHKLWTNANSVDYIGISFPDGSVLGDKNNIKLRFTDKFMSGLNSY